MKKTSSNSNSPEGDAAGQFGGATPSGSSQPMNAMTPATGSSAGPRPSGPSMAAEAWPFLHLIARRSLWILAATGLCALGGFYLGLNKWTTTYSATAQMVRQEQANTDEFFRPQQMTPQTMASLLKSPSLLETVSKEMKGEVTPESLGSRVEVTPEYEQDILTIRAVGFTPEEASHLANLFATNAARLTQTMQQEDARDLQSLLDDQLEEANRSVAALQDSLRKLPKPKLALRDQTPSVKSKILENLQLDEDLAERELASLRRKWQDAHPNVINARENLESIRKEIERKEKELAGPATATTNTNAAAAAGIATTPIPLTMEEADDVKVEEIRSQLGRKEEQKNYLQNRIAAVNAFAAKAPGYYRLFNAAAPHDASASRRELKVGMLTAIAAGFGLFISTLLVLLIEFFDDRIKTPIDVRRVTGLPVLASVGDLSKLGANARANWAFRTWTALQHRLSPSPNHGLVCGVTSSGHGEGCSTWIQELAKAASRRGFKVLTIATMPTEGQRDLVGQIDDDFRAPPRAQQEQSKWDPDDLLQEDESYSDDESKNQAIMADVLSSPMQVTEKLTGADSQPLVHIPLPGWVWNLERRKQWQSALSHWRSIENIVILVELPPASMPESVLLAENIPNLVWLADSGMADAGETRTQLETLRHARCNLVGAVLNHEPESPVKKRFARWFTAPAVALMFLGVVSSLSAQEPSLNNTSLGTVQVAIGQPEPTTLAQNAAPKPAGAGGVDYNTNRTFSVMSGGYRAPWQKRLTLGPGDILNISLYGYPEYDRKEVAVGPDGRVSYLQAHEVMASGRTVDELREALDKELVRHFRTPRTMITPQAFRSKRYYVLGKVTTRGAFMLDRPTTILEAVAQAKGLETGILERNSVDLADLQRASLFRGGQRIQINFEKLFQEGDLSQNVALEPDDFLYFPPTNIKEVYVLGEVISPGPVSFSSAPSLIAAISGRGGFNEKAYKSHVLVVRGSLNNPQAYAVNTSAILDARAGDFKLEPKDIIFVNNRPFSKVEELLDIAATAFLQSAVTAWTGVHVSPIIKSPIIHGPGEQ